MYYIRLLQIRVPARDILGGPFVIKPTDAPISKFYSGNTTLHVSGRFSAHHQELSTVHSALVYLMQV
jgi:hypothetical protein